MCDLADRALRGSKLDARKLLLFVITILAVFEVNSLLALKQGKTDRLLAWSQTDVPRGNAALIQLFWIDTWLDTDAEMNNSCSQQTKENRLPIAFEHVHQMCVLFQIIVVKNIYIVVFLIFLTMIYREKCIIFLTYLLINNTLCK